METNLFQTRAIPAGEREKEEGATCGTEVAGDPSRRVHPPPRRTRLETHRLSLRRDVCSFRNDTRRKKEAAQMKSEREEIERRRRDWSRIVWNLLPIAAFFFLLLVIQRFGLSQQ
jgi:hypothetical protein